MHLSRVFIKNYRSIKKLDVSFEEGKNVIVGRNNSGKSNIVKAIDLVLGETSPTWNKSENITENDFYNGNTDEELFIWCELKRGIDLKTGEIETLDFADAPQQAFKKIVKEDKDIPYHSRVQTNYYINFDDLEKNLSSIYPFFTEKGEQVLEENVDNFSTKWIGEKGYCKGQTFDKEFASIQRVAFCFFVKKEGQEFKKKLGFFYSNDGEKWEMGLNVGNLRHCFLQSAIIPAFRDTKDQLRISSWSWYGKLLKNYIDSENAELKKAFGEVKKASEGVFGELQESVCDGKINIAFPNTKISFQFNPDTKQDVYKNALIYVDDGFNSELKDKGAGIQSAVTIGLFDFYIREVAHTSGSLLAIEEPELYLHPHGRRVISDRLNHFLDGGKNQVIATTHSSEFIVPVGEKLNVIAIQKIDEGGTKAKNISFDPPKRKQILIRRENAEIFFADAVILTEDLKYVLEEVAKGYGEQKRLGENWLNENNVSVLNIGGKTDFWKYVEVLRELEIPYFVLPDFDFIKEGLNSYFTELRESQGKIDALNTLKSQITFGKNIEEISEGADKKRAEKYMEDLQGENIFTLTGELEDFYLSGKKPRFDKEQGVLETISKMIEEGGQISDFLNIDEFEKFFDFFVEEMGYEEPEDPQLKKADAEEVIPKQAKTETKDFLDF